jgi:integrase
MSAELNSTPLPTTSKPTEAPTRGLREARIKPQKPSPDFPLYAHAAGYWAKCIKNRVHYFGPWEDPQGALRKYEDEKADLHAGRLTRDEARAVTVKGMANAFLAAKERKKDAGELTARTWDGYREIMQEMLKGLGSRRLVLDLDAKDFARLRTMLAKRYGPTRMVTFVGVIRSAFNFAFESGMIDRPIRFGPEFVKPSAKTLRLHRAKRGTMMFERKEILAMLEKAKPQIKAMILLAVNCGFGNADVGRLPLSALDLDRGWVNYPRPKTGIDRRCPLWPETVQALREVLDNRPEPYNAADKDIVFVTKYRKAWFKGTTSNPLSHEMQKLLLPLGINGGRNFYALRHTFETIGGESRDQIAVNHIMGHVAHASDMSAVYRERISDERLQAVTDHVRSWLFGQ